MSLTTSNNVRYWLLTIALCAGCATSKTNTQQEKARTRTVICNVPDRCGITP